MINNIVFWMNFNIIQDYCQVRMMIKKDIHLTMKTIENAWNYKMINWDKKLSFLDKKVQDMMNYLEIINSPNNKNNWSNKKWDFMINKLIKIMAGIVKWTNNKHKDVSCNY